MRKIILATAAASLSVPAVAAWDFKVLEDPMTDARRGISVLVGDQGALAIKCDKNGPGSLYVSIIAKSYLGGGRYNGLREIKYRVDGGAVVEALARHDAQTASFFDVRPRTTGAGFLQAVQTSSRLVVQLTSYNGEINTIIFDTTGAREAVEQSARTCGDTDWITVPPG